MDETPIGRVRRVSDMLCSAHAAMRDRYEKRALILDLVLIGVSTWLVAMVFVEPRVGHSLTPFGMPKDIWLGLLAIAAFFVSVVQIKLNWKGLAQMHGQASRMFGHIKADCVATLDAPTNVNQHEIEYLLLRYKMICDTSPEIGESQFLALKGHHKRKVEISKYLDNHPHASLLMLRLRMWLRDNIRK